MAADPPGTGRIYVLAGVNGAGKSSILGAMMHATGAEYFDPDEATRQILEHDPGLSPEEANAAAWAEGARRLDQAIENRTDFNFETTLGGRTITARLEKAAAAGLEVRVWYVGLTTPALHVARVRARVARGGHDIPEARIRSRYDSSRTNLVRLVPRLTELWIYDNSIEGDPSDGVAPSPRLILHARRRRIAEMCAPESVPEWAKPVVQAALDAAPGGKR